VRPVVGFVVNRVQDIASGFAIRSLFGVLRESVVRATHRHCPKCGRGHLFKFREEVNGKSIAALGCNLCDHYQAVDVDNDEDSRDRLKSLARQKMDEVGNAGLKRIKRRLVFGSRAFYCVSFVLFFTSAYFVYEKTSFWTFLNTFALSAYLFVLGLKAAYRHWQLETGRLFVKRAFYEWIREGAWFV